MHDTSSVSNTKTNEDRTGYRVGSREREADTTLEMGKYGIISILAIGGVAGLFGMLFLLGGLISSGSPLNFVSQWVKAAFGG